MSFHADTRRECEYEDFVVADDDPHRTLDILRFCCHVVPFFEPEWAVSTCDFHVTVLSGGITNKLFRVLHIPSRKSVVARVFGKETSRIISRQSELFYQSIFVPTYGKGSNILAYQFLEGYRPLDFTELPAFADAVAESLAAFHITATMASQHDDFEGISRFQRETNHLQFTLKQWIDESLGPSTIEKIVTTRPAKDLFHLGAKTAAEQLLAWQEANFRSSPVGVCHNDLLSGNIMVLAPATAVSCSAKDVCLIDFEYARKNYLLFDLGNHLNEYAGTECDYEKTFPDNAHVARLVASYRSHVRRLLGEQARRSGGELDEGLALAARLFGAGGADFFAGSPDAEVRLVEAWARQVLFFAVCSNLGWGAWALLQAAHSDIDFDFFAYAKARYDRHSATAAPFTTASPSLCAEQLTSL
jgi:ethanolamine kinase